jgi:hypothetical protein
VSKPALHFDTFQKSVDAFDMIAAKIQARLQTR